MSLAFRADDYNELPLMENWLNAGDWTAQHGITLDPSTSTQLFYHAAVSIPTTSSGGGEAASLFEDLRTEPGVRTYPFLKLDTLGLCKENPDGLLVGTGSSSMVDSSANEDEVSEQANSVKVLSANDPCTGSASRFVESDSPRGPLSPAALQLGKANFHKRPLELDPSEASWGSESQTGARKLLKVQLKPVLLQEDDLQAAVGFGPPFVPMASSASDGASPLAMVQSPGGIVFPAPLTLPNVPSMEEIAQSRPKRRNVRISTDPQSVAARHRRERISDRVRVLQHFVPGGTKMDTASMLDEAIHYVKFLQQQLQTLERIGSSYDSRFVAQGGPVMMPQVGHSYSARSFDLNCAVYQTYPLASMAQPSSQQLLPTWPGTRATSPFCSQGFPDSGQEQFCH